MRFDIHFSAYCFCIVNFIPTSVQLLTIIKWKNNRFWLSSCLEAFLRGSGPREQLFVARGGVLAHTTSHIVDVGLRPSNNLQTAFDLLGELVKGNCHTLEMIEASLGDRQFRQFMDVVMSNLVDSNVFLRSLFLSMETISDRTVAARLRDSVEVEAVSFVPSNGKEGGPAFPEVAGSSLRDDASTLEESRSSRCSSPVALSVDSATTGASYSATSNFDSASVAGSTTGSTTFAPIGSHVGAGRGPSIRGPAAEVVGLTDADRAMALAVGAVAAPRMGAPSYLTHTWVQFAPLSLVQFADDDVQSSVAKASSSRVSSVSSRQRRAAAAAAAGAATQRGSADKNISNSSKSTKPAPSSAKKAGGGSRATGSPSIGMGQDKNSVSLGPTAASATTAATDNALSNTSGKSSIEASIDGDSHKTINSDSTSVAGEGDAAGAGGQGGLTLTSLSDGVRGAIRGLRDVASSFLMGGGAANSPNESGASNGTNGLVPSSVPSNSSARRSSPSGGGEDPDDDPEDPEEDPEDLFRTPPEFPRYPTSKKTSAAAGATPGAGTGVDADVGRSFGSDYPSAAQGSAGLSDNSAASLDEQSDDLSLKALAHDMAQMSIQTQRSSLEPAKQENDPASPDAAALSRPTDNLSQSTSTAGENVIGQSVEPNRHDDTLVSNGVNGDSSAGSAHDESTEDQAATATAAAASAMLASEAAAEKEAASGSSAPGWELPGSLFRLSLFLTQERDRILLKLMSIVTIRSINHENICCLNTALLMLILAQKR